MRRTPNRALVGLAASVVVAACTDSTSSGAAHLSVRLTDAPMHLFESAVVEIGEIQLLPADGAPILLTESGGTHDLLTLQNGVTTDIADLDLEPGTYVQLRLIVESASVTLAEGYEFADGGRTRALSVPSGAQTGIKVNLGAADGDPDTEGVEILPGETVLVIDFDVSRNFVIQGNPDTPAGIKGAKFTPSLRAVVNDVAGSIAGTVTSSAAEPLASATVRAKLLESQVLEALQTTEATALTDDAGAYRIRFLAPGTYEVSVDELTATPDTVAVGPGEDVTGIDFTGS